MFLRNFATWLLYGVGILAAICGIIVLAIISMPGAFCLVGRHVYNWIERELRERIPTLPP